MTEITEKKDVITLNAHPQSKALELAIDLIANELIIYFDHFKYIPRVYSTRNNSISINNIIEDYLAQDEKCIVNYSAEHIFSEYFFNVLFVSLQEERNKEFEKRYTMVVILDKTIPYKAYAQQIVVAWGCWQQDRKITKPL